MSQKKKIRAPLPRLSTDVKVVDTHCHLDMAAYAEDRELAIQRAIDAGVSNIITVGIDLASSRAAVALAGKYAEIFATVGIHPHDVGGLTAADYHEIAMLASQPKVVAYGEIGIDLVRNYSPIELQKEHFIKQVQLGKQLQLPLIIHDREAHREVMDILKRESPFPAGGVMHCFSGDMALAQEVLGLGFYISIPGVVTFNKAPEMQEVARSIPLDMLLVETDGPFLAPAPMRGKRNEPAYVLYTAEKIAELRGESLSEVAIRTTQNARKLFGI